MLNPEVSMPLFPVKTMAPAALWSSAPQSHRQSGPGNRGASAESGEEKRENWWKNMN
jgi:hypothetical protein